MTYQISLSPFGQQGERKYLNAHEYDAFYTWSEKLPLEKRLFCQLIYYTGARISEIYQLTPQRFDFSSQLVIVRTLKKRQNNIYRQIPIPEYLMKTIFSFIVHEKNVGKLKSDTERLWSFSPRTASRAVKKVMNDAGIQGVQASAKGLRHAFAVHGVSEVPLTKVQKWMGHGHVSTTAIYLDVSGAEEREWAEKMWRTMRSTGNRNPYDREKKLSGEDYRKIKINCLESLKNIEHISSTLKNSIVANDNFGGKIDTIKMAILEIYSTLNAYHDNPQKVKNHSLEKITYQQREQTT